MSLFSVQPFPSHPPTNFATTAPSSLHDHEDEDDENPGSEETLVLDANGKNTKNFSTIRQDATTGELVPKRWGGEKEEAFPSERRREDLSHTHKTNPDGADCICSHFPYALRFSDENENYNGPNPITSQPPTETESLFDGVRRPGRKTSCSVVPALVHFYPHVYNG
jgi:hypothetical protein